jgi:DNA repair exonuclease SbcCD nuclease subunit
MNKFKTSDTGFNTKIFKTFDKIFSGHFHIRDIQTKHGTDIVYIGSPYALDRNDMNEEKGFCILDLDTLDYEFINNKTSIKYKSIKYPESINEKTVLGNIVDVCVEYNDKYSEEKFQQYLVKVQQFEPISVHVKLINNFLSGEELVELEDYQSMNIEKLIQEYIDSLEIKQKDEISNIINELYDEVKEVV